MTLSIAAMTAAEQPEISAPVSAQTLIDALEHHELATRLCTNCNAIDRQASSSIRADVPSFSTIANRPGATAEHLAGRIIVPHPAGQVSL